MPGPYEPTCSECGKPRELGKRCKHCTSANKVDNLELRCAVRRNAMQGHRSLSGFAKSVLILQKAAKENK